MRPRLGKPFEVKLPSGRGVTVTCRRVDAKPRDLFGAIETKAIESSIDPFDLPLSDAHVLEAIAAGLGAIDAPPIQIECRNCKKEVSVDAASSLPIDPLLDPPGDEDLDRAHDFSEKWAFSRSLDVGRRRATEMRLRPRTLRDRKRLEEILGDDAEAPLPIGAPLVRALGVVLVDEKGSEVESPIAIARALERADDETFDAAWSTIVRAWDEAHYPPRTLSPAACPLCSARHDLEVVHRPLAWLDAPRESKPAAPFASLEEFRARAESIAREVIEAADLPSTDGLEVLVDDDVPPCDDGGEPLLGSYTPTPEADGDVLRSATSPFTIALYFRSFRDMYEDEPYDVDAEIRETIEHELEHHVGFLRGEDPLDDEEREEIAREHARLHGRRTEAQQVAAGVGWLAGDVGKFLRATWPLWLLVAIALLVVVASSR